MKIRVEFTERDIERGKMIAEAFSEKIVEDKVKEELVSGNFGTFKTECTEDNGGSLEVNFSEMFMEDATYLIVRVANGIKGFIDMLKPAFKNFVQKYSLPSKSKELDDEMVEKGNIVKVSLVEPSDRDGVGKARLHYFTSYKSAIKYVKEQIDIRHDAENIQQVYDLEMDEDITNTIINLACEAE